MSGAKPKPGPKPEDAVTRDDLAAFQAQLEQLSEAIEGLPTLLGIRDELKLLREIAERIETNAAAMRAAGEAFAKLSETPLQDGALRDALEPLRVVINQLGDAVFKSDVAHFRRDFEARMAALSEKPESEDFIDAA